MKLQILLTVLVLELTVSIAYALLLLDRLVHSTLYYYGLTFSYEWANPYWVAMRTILAFLVVTAILASVSTIYVYLRYVRTAPAVEMVRSEKPVAPSVVPSVATEPKPKSAHGLNRCSRCGKGFSRPLQMLNFHDGRPKVVNTCPFCNAVVEVVHREEESLAVQEGVEA